MLLVITNNLSSHLISQAKMSSLLKKNLFTSSSHSMEEFALWIFYAVPGLPTLAQVEVVCLLNAFSSYAELG